MRSTSEFTEPPGLWVTVDDVIYQPNVPTPVDRPHCFVYFISIHNDTPVPVTIKGRKWIVTNALGEITAVEGDGVVGQFPTIPPGDKFSYNSFHLLDTSTGKARGSFLGLDDNGRTVIARIPAFDLIVPDTATS
jgi:ApaG protein